MGEKERRVFKSNISLRCIHCESSYPPDPWLFFCPTCGNLLEPVFQIKHQLKWKELGGDTKGVWRYKKLIPLRDDIQPVTLGEGSTPLIPIRETHGRAFLKFEGANPTGSFKDRGMTVGVTIAKYINARGVVVASTGNTAASAAAYAARAGLKCIVYLPKGSIALGKIAQALLHGAEVTEIEGVFDKALDEVLTSLDKSREAGLYPLNSYNPWRLEGQKTIAFEIAETLREVPDVIIVPVGNAGNISAIWKGFKELHQFGLIDRLPRMIGVQAEGASPLYLTWKQGASDLIRVKSPNTIASAIRIGRPVNWLKALKSVKESNGSFVSVSDTEIIECMKRLARVEGIGVESASAASFAGYLRSLDEKVIDKDESAVVIATGHALKEPDLILSKLVK